MVLADALSIEGDPRSKIIQRFLHGDFDADRIESLPSQLITSRWYYGHIKEACIKSALAPEVIEALCETGYAHFVRALKFESDWLVRPQPAALQGIRLLADLECFGRLEGLDIAGNNVLDEGACLIAAAPVFSNLTDLGLKGTSIGSSGAQAIARSTPLRQLRTLDLSHCSLDSSNVEALGHGDALSSLEALDLSGNYVNEGLVRLLSAGTLRQLSRLRVDGAGLGPFVIEAMLSLPCAAHFKELSICGNVLGWQGAQNLAGIQHLVSPEKLGLAENELTDEALDVLLDGPLFKKVEDLDLSGNALTDAGMNALMRGGVFNGLRRLKIQDTAVTEQYVEQTSKSHPSLVIHRG